MRMTRSLAAFVGACGLAAAAPAATIFVDDDAAPGGDGASWATAFAHLQDGLAASGAGDEIRVAGGVYNPDTSAANPAGSGARAATFTLKNGVTVSGGWAGAADPAARDTALYETVLSGDLNGDDTTGGSNAENSYHVLFFVAVNVSATVDGVTVEGGNANATFSNGQGGGLIHALADLFLFDVTFRDNYGSSGGGAYVQDGLVDFVGCTFEGNSASRGGGIYRAGAESTFTVFIEGCTFDGNSANIGGGIDFFNNRAGVEVNRSIFINNSANTFGGAINGMGGGQTLANSLVAGNTAGNCGGGVGVTSSPGAINPLIINTTIADNSAGSVGGGVCQTSSDTVPFVQNSIVFGNDDASGTGETAQIGRFFGTSPFADVSYSVIDGYNPGGDLDGVGNSGDDPLFVSPALGDYHLSVGSPAVDSGLDSLYPGGLAAFDLNGDARFVGPAVDMGAFELTNPDSDGDGLLDADEAVLGTDPFNPDTDGDGLLDGTEVDAAMGTGCPDPLSADSDGDTLSDGDEVTDGTDPCSGDTDGDGVDDASDPTPTVPGVPQETLEVIARDTADDIGTTDLGSFTAPNNNAAKGRRNSLSNRLQGAAKKIAKGDYDGARDKLNSALDKLDGEPQPPDWVDGGDAADLRAQIQLILDLIDQL